MGILSKLVKKKIGRKNKKPDKDNTSGSMVGNALRWLGKTGAKIAPEILNLAGNLTGINTLNQLGDLIQGDTNLNPQQKDLLLEELRLDIEAFKIEVEDRKSARELYKEDDTVQKIFAMVFLLGYGLLSYYLLSILIGNTELPQLAETMITMIWTGTSMKLNTIIDFFFGGSFDKNKK